MISAAASYLGCPVHVYIYIYYGTKVSSSPLAYMLADDATAADTQPARVVFYLSRHYKSVHAILARVQICVVPCFNIFSRSCQEARNTLSSHTGLEKLNRTLLNYVAPLQPGFLHCQLAYEPDKTCYLTGWMHTRSLALPFRIRLDGTTLNLASNPHQRHKSSYQ